MINKVFTKLLKSNIQIPVLVEPFDFCKHFFKGNGYGVKFSFVDPDIEKLGLDYPIAPHAGYSLSSYSFLPPSCQRSRAATVFICF